MTLQNLRERRNAYAYPTIGLIRQIRHNGEFLPREFPSTYELDQYHHRLLHSSEPNVAMLGYASVIFWGHCSGKDLRLRQNRAMSRVQLAFAQIGPDQLSTVDDVAIRLKAAASSLRAGNCSAALKCLWHLPQLGPAFASKVCGFPCPDHCGVIDSVIAQAYPGLGFSTDYAGNIAKSCENATRYDAFCRLLRQGAAILNQDGSCGTWVDRDGKTHPWRALDLERALYGG